MADHQTTVALSFHVFPFRLDESCPDSNGSCSRLLLITTVTYYGHLEFWSKNPLLGRRFSSRWWSLSSWNCWNLIWPANQNEMCRIAKAPDLWINLYILHHFTSFYIILHHFLNSCWIDPGISESCQLLHCGPKPSPWEGLAASAVETRKHAAPVTKDALLLTRLWPRGLLAE